MDITKLFSLEGKSALVTGSSQGIGAAIARGLVDAGAQVWLHGLEEDKGKALAAELGGRFVGGDLTDSGAIQALAATLAANQDSLDILVNNAGIFVPAKFEQLEMAVFDRVLQVNLRAPIELTNLLLPLLKRSPGAAIINITSIHQTTPHPRSLPYCVAKAGLEMFAKFTALELAPYGIRINSLAPGTVETDINRANLEAMGRDQYRERIPLDIAQTDQLIGPAVFLASEASSYLTGTTVYADGGYLQNLLRYPKDT